MSSSEQLSVYCGFDPTADSLHLGKPRMKAKDSWHLQLAVAVASCRAEQDGLEWGWGLGQGHGIISKQACGWTEQRWVQLWWQFVVVEALSSAASGKSSRRRVCAASCG